MGGKLPHFILDNKPALYRAVACFAYYKPELLPYVFACEVWIVNRHQFSVERIEPRFSHRIIKIKQYPYLVNPNFFSKECTHD